MFALGRSISHEYYLFTRGKPTTLDSPGRIWHLATLLSLRPIATLCVYCTNPRSPHIGQETKDVSGSPLGETIKRPTVADKEHDDLTSPETSQEDVAKPTHAACPGARHIKERPPCPLVSLPTSDSNPTPTPTTATPHRSHQDI